MVTTTTVIGLLSADVTIDIIDYFNKFKIVFMPHPNPSPKERDFDWQCVLFQVLSFGEDLGEAIGA
jgi:hypothetical protein